MMCCRRERVRSHPWDHLRVTQSKRILALDDLYSLLKIPWKSNIPPPLLLKSPVKQTRFACTGEEAGGTGAHGAVLDGKTQ